jgi:hypothetical protein
MKTLLILICSVVLSVGAFADQQVTIYKPNSNGKVARGCVSVVFQMTGVWTGTIGNATFANTTATQTVLPINAVGEGKLLGEIPYTIVGAGSLIIVEVR